jgi:hypothetical protein
MNSDIRYIYNHCQKKIGNLVTGVVTQTLDDKTIIDIGEEHIEAFLKNNFDIRKDRIYSEGDCIYGCISSVSISEDESKVNLALERKSDDFIKKLFIEQAGYMGFDDIVISSFQRDIGVKSLLYVENIHDESALDSIESIMKEELYPEDISLGIYNEEVQDSEDIVETNEGYDYTVDNIINKGDIITHKEFGKCKVIFKVESQRANLIGIKLNDNTAKVLDEDEVIENIL